MDIQIEIPYGGSKASLFVSNIPAWLIWFIVIFAGSLMAIHLGLFNF